MGRIQREAARRHASLQVLEPRQHQGHTRGQWQLRAGDGSTKLTKAQHARLPLVVATAEVLGD